MKHIKLRRLIFLALCCDLGLFTKRLIAPAANLLTDSLHIPGGISTSFSLMFLVIAAVLTPGFGCSTLMGAVQPDCALPGDGRQHGGPFAGGLHRPGLCHRLRRALLQEGPAGR